MMPIHSLPKWEPGRQGTGYFKMKLFEFSPEIIIKIRSFIFTFFAIDCYLLKYPKNSYVEPHLDKVNTNHYREHHRLNIVLRQASKGGVFCKIKSVTEHLEEGVKISEKVYPFHGKVNKFRADKELHGVTRITEGTRYVLSIGWVR